MSEQLLEQARDACQRGDWTSAYELLRAPGVVDDADPQHLELLATTAYGVGEYEACIGAWESLHALHMERGDTPAAAWTGAMVAMYLMMDSGLMAPVRGWLRRVDRLLEGHEEVPAHALVAMVRIYERFMSGDMEQARVWADRSLELGERQQVPPAALFGRMAGARITIFDGDVDEGLAALDEVAADLMAGVLDPLSTGMAQCELVCAMLGLGQYERAEEWTAAMDTWRTRGDFPGGINGRCRVHRAEMLRLRGSCAEAEEEALQACRELEPWMRREFGWPLTELGTIRVRRGDLAGAQEAFGRALAMGWDPQPGLARARLAGGDADGATEMLLDALDHPRRIPSKERPPGGALTRAPVLDALAQAAAAAGRAEPVARAAEELTSIAERFGTASLHAMATAAQARLALLRGTPGEAVPAARRAVDGWARAGLPYETAVARVLLAEAHEADGATGLAENELRAARAGFEAIGAELWVRRVDELLATTVDDGSPGVAAGAVTRAVFAARGDSRVIEFDGLQVQLGDLKGMRHLARLLAEPGREFHALDLVAAEEGALRLPGPAADRELDVAGTGAGAMLDDEARDAYRRRLVEIDEDIEDAELNGDLERASAARADRDFLVAELSRAFGLGGRVREAADDAERARVTVTRALRYALKRIAEHHRPLSEHLDRTIRTGIYCAYEPDPRAPIEWSI